LDIHILFSLSSLSLYLSVCVARFVGDSYDKDVQGAKNAGMHSLFLVREDHASHPLRRRPQDSSDNGVDEEKELKDLKACFPDADWISFTLHPSDLMKQLNQWQCGRVL
jgi:hypothetical protein